MVDPDWPLTSSYNNDDDETRTRAQGFLWMPDDPLDLPDLPPLVFPRPLVDKALINRDDKEMR